MKQPKRQVMKSWKQSVSEGKIGQQGAARQEEEIRKVLNLSTQTRAAVNLPGIDRRTDGFFEIRLRMQNTEGEAREMASERQVLRAACVGVCFFHHS